MDIRTITTEERIKEGLLNLLEKKKLEKCSVSDIVEYSEVSKRTFYTYYKDKHDLLNAIETQLIEGLKRSLAQDREPLAQLGHIPDAEEINQLADVAFNNTITFCNQNKGAFSKLLSSNGDMYFYQKIIKVGTHEFNQRFPYLFQEKEGMLNDSLTLKFIRNVYVHGIIDILVLWSGNDGLIGTQDVKRLLGLTQTKSPLELVNLYKLELKLYHNEHQLL